MLLLLHNYAALSLVGFHDTVWLTSSSNGKVYTHMLFAIYLSFITMTTFGYFDLLPKSNLLPYAPFHPRSTLMTPLVLLGFITLSCPKDRDPIELSKSLAAPEKPRTHLSQGQKVSQIRQPLHQAAFHPSLRARFLCVEKPKVRLLPLFLIVHGIINRPCIKQSAYDARNHPAMFSRA